MKNYYKVGKFLALSIPALMSVLILASVILGGFNGETKYIKYESVNNNPQETYQLNEQFELYKQNLDQNYQNAVNSIDSKLNIGLALIGLAVTVWVGLNIFNVVERKEIESLTENYEELNKSIKEGNETVKELQEVIKYFEAYNSWNNALLVCGSPTFEEFGDAIIKNWEFHNNTLIDSFHYLFSRNEVLKKKFELDYSEQIYALLGWSIAIVNMVDADQEKKNLEIFRLLDTIKETIDFATKDYMHKIPGNKAGIIQKSNQSLLMLDKLRTEIGKIPSEYYAQMRTMEIVCTQIEQEINILKEVLFR